MHKSLFALLGLSHAIFAAENSCAPEPPATCYPDDCMRCYCLGPAQQIANAPVCPLTCNGDWKISLAGLYWKAQEDGLEYAIDNDSLTDVIETIYIHKLLSKEQKELLLELYQQEPRLQYPYLCRSIEDLRVISSSSNSHYLLGFSNYLLSLLSFHDELITLKYRRGS